MHPLSYGFKQFDTGDRAKGSTGWMAAWEFNTARLNTHNHDGINSTKLSITAFDTLSSTITAASWVVDGSGYKKTVTVPAAILDIASYEVQFYIADLFAGAGQRLYLDFTKVTSTTFDVFCNDNTIDVVAIYR